MDFMPHQIFYGEVERQCKFALMAYEDLKQALTDCRQPRPTRPTASSKGVAQIQASMARLKQWMSAMDNCERVRPDAQDRLWYSVQAFLVAAGNISKLLWPSYRKGEERIPERGPELRASLQPAGFLGRHPLLAQESRTSTDRTHHPPLSPPPDSRRCPRIKGQPQHSPIVLSQMSRSTPFRLNLSNDAIEDVVFLQKIMKLQECRDALSRAEDGTAVPFLGRRGDNVMYVALRPEDDA